jgi:YYY domain-containing protein
VPCGQPVPEDAINFWNASYSPLNPHFFAYGSLPMYLIKFAAQVATTVSGTNWGDYQNLFLVGRFISVCFSLGTILLLFFLGRRAFAPSLGKREGDAIGLLAAAFLSVSTLDIQLAHFLAFDEPLTFFITLAVFVALGQMRNGSRWGALRLGIAVGLALATKFSAAPVAIAAGLAILFYGLYGNAKYSGERIGKPAFQPWPGETRYGEVALGPRLIFRTLGNLLIMALATLVTWFVAMPYAFIDFKNYSDRLIEEGGMARGIDSFPYTRQFVGTTPVLYQFENIILWSVGLPLGILIVVSLFYSVWRCITGRLKAEIIVWGWLLPYMVAIFSFEAKFIRYNLPLIPLFILLAARLIIEIHARLRRNQALFSSHEPVLVEKAEDTEKQLEEPVTKPSRPHRWARLAIRVIGIFTFVWSSVWALSFEHIYSQTHTRVQASEWIYKNVPAGSGVSGEIWDESLPLPIGINSPSQYKPVGIDLYPDITPSAEVDNLVKQIEQADYIVESSNRLYATMPKLPWRYPVQNRYFELLFGGHLGYKLVASFTEYPQIPLLDRPINDDHADESFTVYDHPKVLIFKKVDTLSDAQLHGLFELSIHAPWVPKRHPQASDLPAQQVGEQDGALETSSSAQVNNIGGSSLLLDKPVDQLPVIDDIGWNRPANDQQWFGVLLWFVLAQILGLIGLPLAMRVGSRLPDKGYILAKPIGAAVMALVIWLIVSSRVLMNTVGTNYLGLGVSIVASAWLWWRYRDEMTLFFQQRRKLIMIEEGLFLFAFVVFLLIRLGNPDLWHPTMGGEKPMELSHVYALLKSAYFPPYDPWFSDGYLNYYYYGQYMFTTWMKLTGIQPGIAFNFAIPIIYAFTFTAAFSLVLNLTGLYERRKARLEGEDFINLSLKKPIIAGLFGSLLLAILGNLDIIVQIGQTNPQVVNFFSRLHIYSGPIEVLKQFDYWRSHLVVPYTINEFPYFSFLYADFHANVIALPYTIVILCIALNLLSTNWLGYQEKGLNLWQKLTRRVWQVCDSTLLVPIVLAVLLGLLGATNTWDLPTYLVITCGAFLLALLRRPKQVMLRDTEELERKPRFSLTTLGLDLGLTVTFMVLLLVVGIALYWNFYAHFQAIYSSIKFTFAPDSASLPGFPDFTPHTLLLYFGVHFGIFLFFIVSYLVWSFRDWSRLPIDTASNDKQPNNPKQPIDLADELDEINPITPASSYAKPIQNLALPLVHKRPELSFAMAGADGGNFSLDDTDSWNDDGFWREPPFPYGQNRSRFNPFIKPWLIGLGILGVLVILFAIFNYIWGLTAVMLWTIIALLILMIVRTFDPDPMQAAKARSAPGILVNLILLAACAIVTMTEIIYLADDLQEEIYERMNTIFKFYYQVWTMFAVAAAFGGYMLWTNVIAPRLAKTSQAGPAYTDPFRNVGRFAWTGAAVFLLVCGFMYPLLTTGVKLDERDAESNNKYCYPTPATEPMPFGWDGQAYLNGLHCVVGMTNMQPGLHFDFKYDAQAIKDFYSKIPGTPVVLQAAIEPYRGGGTMVTINTGLPAVLGWDHHETQQRYPAQVYQRSFLDCCEESGTVREIYNTDDISRALQLLNHYHVTYIQMGVVEREAQVEGPHDSSSRGQFDKYMSDAGYAKFDTMVKLGLLTIAYHNEGVDVYQLTTKGMSGVVEGVAGATGDSGGITGINIRLQRLLDDVKRDPSNPDTHRALGQYYVGVKDYQKAAAELETVVKLSPNQVNAYHVLGDVYEAMGENSLALDTYKKAEEIAPNEPAAWNKVGMALVERNQLEAALVQFQQATKISPTFVEAYYHQGEIYEKQGKSAQAVDAYRNCVSKAESASDFWASHAQQRLQKLGAT